MNKMTPLQRVLTTLGHKEPDRVPLFLLLTMHGAKELGMSLQEYFSSGENVAEGQVRLRTKYEHDCYYPFFYAAVEVEAWGGGVIYQPDGPPNAGAPIIRDMADILKLDPPGIKGNPPLAKVLKSIEILKARGEEVPIVGVVMSPFSLPIMQMGFEPYLQLMHEHQDLFQRLMDINEDFIVSWANAQLDAGATAITYFDPVASPSMVPRETYLKTGFKVAQRTLAKINGPTAVHVASGRALPIIDDIVQLETAIVGTSTLENLSDLKDACKGRLTVLGNLNGIEMCRWTKQETVSAVRSAIEKAGPGGGFILADNHGEIPFQVTDETLMTIVETVRTYGKYPLDA